MDKKPSFLIRIRNWIRELFRVYCLEFSLIIHDMGLVLFFTFLPLAYPVIYSLIYNPEIVTEVPMVVVDDDRTPLSRELVRQIGACEQARIAGYAAEMSEARRAMAQGDCYGILHIPEGMQRKVGRMEQAPAVLYCNADLLLRYRGFLVATTSVMENLGSELMTKTIDNTVPLAETVANGDLLPIENVNLGNIKAGFDSFIMPGVLILILQQCLVLAVGMAGGAKRENPELLNYDRANISGSTLGTMLGQALCYFTIIIIPAIYLIHYVPLMFRFPMEGDIIEEIALLIPLIFSSIGLGFCFQSIVTERESVFLLWVSTSLIFLFLSGLIWPLYAMPKVWSWLSAVCPSTWGVEAFIKMNANGSSLAQVSGPYINLWILTAVYWVIGWAAQKWDVRPAIRKWISLRKSITDASGQIWPDNSDENK